MITLKNMVEKINSKSEYEGYLGEYTIGEIYNAIENSVPFKFFTQDIDDDVSVFVFFEDNLCVEIGYELGYEYRYICIYEDC